MCDIEICLVDPAATKPEEVFPMAMGYDLFASEGLLLEKGKRVFVSTGVSITVPPHCFATITGRAAMNSIKVNVHNTVFDCCYEGIVRVLLENNGTHDLPILTGDKIATLVVLPLEPPVVQVNSEIITITTKHSPIPI